MKTLNIYAALLFSIFAINSSFAQKNTVLDRKESIKVWGNCETCKKHIENAAKSAGAKTANWNDETKMLALAYDGAKTTLVKIQNAIAASGYDTQDFKGNDQAYSKLMSCCKYDRNTSYAGLTTKANTKAADCKNMKCCKNKNCCDKNKKCNSTACKSAEECKDMGCCKS